MHPELTGIGRYTGEMVAFLSNEGHEVRVVTAPPYYPYWRVQKEYKWWQYRRESWKGIKIYRAPLWVPKKPTGVKRLLHLFSFAISSFPLLLLQALWLPDVIMCVAPTFFSAPFALLTARLCGAKAWLHLHDFELDVATNLGMLPSNHPLTKLAAGGERWLLRRFDKVSTISNGMIKRLERKGVSKGKIDFFPNWVDTHQIFPLTKNYLRKKLQIRKKTHVVLYHGNMGHKQGLEILIDIATQFRQEKRILFLLCGEGPVRAELERRGKGLPNMRFLDLQPEEKLNQLVNLATIHVLPQRPGAADLVMPSKLVTMLASGKPIIASAASGTELWKVVNEVGLVIRPEDTSAMAEAISTLINDPNKCLKLGHLAREYACYYLDKGKVLSRFQKSLKKVMHNL